KTISKLIEIGVLCNNSELKYKDNEWTVDGEVTEGALVVLAAKAGIKKEELHQRHKRIKEHPFDPSRKLMSTVHVVEDRKIAYVKGAPERVLERCSYYFTQGKVKKLDAATKEKIMNKNSEFASSGLRVLALAFKEVKGDHHDINEVESNLCFVGLVSIRDPPQESVKESIEKCKMAGIKVVMITGDSEPTARAISQELGILTKDSHSITGPELDSMDDEEFLKVVENITVYARVTPEHKLRIVNAFQAKGHIVAMTGDGVNDAPALKKADIGVAMGMKGTEVAKEAAEIVLKDDNFTTIVKAVEEGRNIYSNIRRFIYYLLVGNISEVIVLVLAVLIGAPLPLTALMYLFLNLVTSDFPAIGLALEKVNPRIMRQKPRDPQEGILSDYIMLKIAQLIPLVVLGTLTTFMWFLLMKKTPLPEAQTAAFVTLIMFELFHAYNARSLQESVFSIGIFSNKYLNIGVLASFLATLTLLYFPPAARVFGVVPLNTSEWISITLMAASILFFMEIEKVVVSSEIKERKKLELYPTRED
ncbi:HAD family hydrolase, partial [Candidatus Woesearchaeota archaeon]